MAVYVDGLRHYPGWKWPACHLTADTQQELLVFGDMIGMKRAWLQHSSRGAKAHYDISPGKRRQAIAMGAVVRRGEGKEKERPARE